MPKSSGRLGALAVLVFCALSGLGGCAANRGVPGWMRGWNDPRPPFRVVGNIHFVGTNRMGIFLITTPAGHILLDTGFDAKVPQLQRSVAALGFRWQDIKIILASHAHIDHVQAHALVRQQTGAKVVVSRDDAPTITSGGKHEWMYGDEYSWAPCPVDQIIDDGQSIELGGTRLVAHQTPGHSRGATTWTMSVADPEAGPKPLDVVFFPSGSIPAGVRVVGNPAYPEAVSAYAQSFATWRALPCDVFLAAHSDLFDLDAKYARLRAGARPNPFIDHAGYVATIDKYEARFKATVAAQR
jgi:metallo-beta-lactamase class B